MKNGLSLKEGVVTFHPMQNNQINITQGDTSVGVMEKWISTRKEKDDSSSHSPGDGKYEEWRQNN